MAEYLYGTQAIVGHDDIGTLVITYEDVREHRLVDKVIPSCLFRRPEGRHLSGVLFSNNHTVAMFDRIGTERGLAAPDTALLRFGSCHDPDPDAAQARPFAYIVDSDTAPEDAETFSEGLHLFLNPWAYTPLTPCALPGLTVHELLDTGQAQTTAPPGPGLHPFASKTMIFEGEHADLYAQYMRLVVLGLAPADAAPNGPAQSP